MANTLAMDRSNAPVGSSGSIRVISVFGRDVRELFSTATGAMAGNTNVSNGAIRATVNENKGLKGFGQSGPQGDR